MNILISNDDGFNSKGIEVLIKNVSKKHNVFVVAPDRERSAVSHKITLTNPIRVNRIADNFYTTDASPADCIKISFLGIIKESIDLVISGINHGPNMGLDVFYSGTVAVAREGVMKGVPGIAFSLDSYDQDGDFEYAAGFINQIIDLLSPAFNINSRFKPLFNVNFPKYGPYKGFKFTRLGFRVYREMLIEHKDPMGNPYYWIGGELPTHNPRENSDFDAVKNGFVSITPLAIDISDYRMLEKIKSVIDTSKLAI
ncbi:MAG TPA: 5'/3'-nucleotidase SurE [Spirochaetota bacterium]|nr:5'/3'-nucleotidase SurE [Spirochaetota bacterium]HOM38719.1 5'/3'-nucleotidase SurE [Spirochaetota bacterium]HPQ49516.1 5'/3'-nucleotidase SurE [Spirochaetota bacterium]